MKRALMTVAALLAASSAFAGITMTGKLDYVNNPDYKDFQNPQGSVDGYSRFMAQGLVMDFNGKLGDDGGFVGRFDLLGQANGNQQGGANYNAFSFVDRLYVTKPFGAVTMSFGRLYNPDGGFEKEAMDTFSDYGTSFANGGSITDPIVAAGFLGTHLVNPENLNGIGVAYKIQDGQKLELQVTDESDAYTATPAHKRHNESLNYMGDFMDKSLRVAVGYLSGADDFTRASMLSQTDMHAGVKYMVADFDLTFEYFGNTAHSNATGAKDDKLTDMYFQVGYKTNGWRPFLKYEMASVQYGGKDDFAGNNLLGNPVESFKRTAYTVGVEYTPKAGDAFSYHLTYTGDGDKPGVAGANTMNSTLIAAGITVTADILK